jgi:hypothetical protein
VLLAGCQPPLNIFCSILSTVGALCENDFTQVFWYFYCSGQRVWPNPDTFHPGSLDDSPRGDQFLYEWYSKQPKALDEPSLWTLSKTQKEQSYRFLWLRTFHHPAAVRIDVNGTSRLTTKIASGAGGYARAILVQNDTSALTKEQTDWFLEKNPRKQVLGIGTAGQVAIRS